ncbi:hypothetical protein [Chelativorans salis]|uniref:Uncharacterized protein n=1 Tax=Chelativorans salis TaxID=2978478 RepID=A0ABT2LI88_9HYPH|nr:hypothetical protein [Chelativorans sp. EGI FJ00035]MCT7374102.1 hypothetical protein [Chelativorans sp. EGI FJ00035]
MLNWISGNSDVLNVALSGLMLVVWGLYFQLLLNGYRRERRPKILINRANGHVLETQCVVTNMSAEAIYIEGVVTELRGENGDDNITCSLTDHGGRVEPERTAEQDGYEGPLNSGRSVELGSYSKIIEHALEQGDGSISSIVGVSLTVVATYGPEDTPVAATRVYDVAEEAGTRILYSETVTTQQIRSASERRQLERFMREQLGARADERHRSPLRSAAE